MSSNHFYLRKDNKFVKLDGKELEDLETDFFVNLSLPPCFDERYYFQDLSSALEFYPRWLEGTPICI